jgi:hypothetical protein
MIDLIRTRLVATLATAVTLVAAATGTAAADAYEPFVTDFPKQIAPAEFIPFVTDFGIAPRAPGGTVVIRSTQPTGPVPATSTSRDWADVGIGAGLGLGFAGLAAAATLGLRRRRRSIGPVEAGAAGIAE